MNKNFSINITLKNKPILFYFWIYIFMVKCKNMDWN